MKPEALLNVGDTIPDFWTRDITGTEVDSRGLSKGHTLIAFMRSAGCPFCNLAIYRLAQEYKLLKKSNCDVIVFVQSSEANIEKNITPRHQETIPFPIIADQHQDFYQLFGVRPNAGVMMRHSTKHAAQWMEAAFEKGFRQAKIDGASMMVPAYFLVNDKGVIQLLNYDAALYDDSAFTPIYDVLTFGPVS